MSEKKSQKIIKNLRNNTWDVRAPGQSRHGHRDSLHACVEVRGLRADLAPDWSGHTNAGLWLADVSTCTPRPRPGSRWSSPACWGRRPTCPPWRPSQRKAEEKNNFIFPWEIKYPPWYAVTYSALFWRILFHFYTISKNKDPIPPGHKDSLSKIKIEYLIIDRVRWNYPPSGPQGSINKLKYEVLLNIYPSWSSNQKGFLNFNSDHF